MGVTTTTSELIPHSSGRQSPKMSSRFLILQHIPTNREAVLMHSSVTNLKSQSGEKVRAASFERNTGNKTDVSFILLHLNTNRPPGAHNVTVSNCFYTTKLQLQVSLERHILIGFNTSWVERVELAYSYFVELISLKLSSTVKSAFTATSQSSARHY